MILYLCSMKKEKMIALLQQQNSFLQQQLQEANRKADALLVEITSLRSLLECKSEEGAKQKRVIKGLAKMHKTNQRTALSDITSDKTCHKILLNPQKERQRNKK